jgi:hypothetical protein
MDEIVSGVEEARRTPPPTPPLPREGFGEDRCNRIDHSRTELKGTRMVSGDFVEVKEGPASVAASAAERGDWTCSTGTR